jgi:anti-sigma B factor antagonist
VTSSGFFATFDGSSVVAAGEIDMASAPVLRDAFENAVTQTPENLVVDLTKVTFMDSSGISVLFEYAGRGLEILIAQGSILADVMRITRLSDAATIRAV